MEDDLALRAAELGRPGGTRDVSVVCQHVVIGGFPVPAQAICLDFYLNVLHPRGLAIPIHELPDLSLIKGDRVVTRQLFAPGFRVPCSSRSKSARRREPSDQVRSILQIR